MLNIIYITQEINLEDQWHINVSNHNENLENLEPTQLSSVFVARGQLLDMGLGYICS